MKPGLKRFIIHFTLIIGVIITIILLSQTWLRHFTRHGQALIVPDFTGLTLQQAQKVAKTHSLRLEVLDSLFLANRTRGSIFRQIPESGEKVKKNRRILVTINSILPRKVNAPSLVGFSLRQAKAEITSQNFQLGKLTYVYDIATNSVLAQYYHGELLMPGTLIEAQSTIDLTLGVHPDYNRTYIPNVVGVNLEMAKDIITDHSLNVGRVIFDSSVRTASDSLLAVIIRQSPEASESAVWTMGHDVNLSLSLPTTESDAKRGER
jgi:beta-lactam-binding protein with PASTA domain